MFKDIAELIAYKIKELATSRMLPLIVIAVLMAGVLTIHLYNLQIVSGQEAQEEYINNKTLKTIELASTRGNIYDRNGKLLAYNKLVYSVSLSDTGEYNGYQKNLMILRLLKILDKRDEQIVTPLALIIDDNNTVQYSGGTSTIQGMLRDVYGKKSYQEVVDDPKLDENISAEGLFEYLCEHYGIGKESSGENAKRYEISKTDALRVINLRYLLASNYFRRYKSVIVAEDVSEETMSEILEHNDTLSGVNIEEEYKRVYNDSIYFAHVIGYTGTASVDDLERLNSGAVKGEERYKAGDVVGKTGIEASMEDELQGIKGSRTMYLDSLGRILEVAEEVDPTTGNDVYITLDDNLQVGIYHLIEQHLAGIIIDKLDNAKVHNSVGASSSHRRLSVYEAYYQMINNNILDIDAFETASPDSAQSQIYSSFLSGQQLAYEAIREELLSDNPIAYKDLGDPDIPQDENFMKIYFSCVYDILLDSGYLISSEIDRNDDIYIAYKTAETISPSEFFKYALSSGWVDVSKLDMSGSYSSADATYTALVDKIDELIKGSLTFTKRIYKNLIYNQQITGREICLALIEQGIVNADEEETSRLQEASGSSVAAFEFITSKIKSLEITPAMLAMDPCSAAVTIVDIYTGDVLACVSYPSYDNNKLSGTIDSKYYNKLVNDLSSPLYNTATQAQKAPGSVFKLVTTAASIEEGVLDAGEYVETEGVFTRQGLNLNCSYYSTYHESHGNINVISAIAQSCNYFFCEMGWRLSQRMDEETGELVYNEPLGISMINDYATRLGLGEKTGIELTENSPAISDTAPIPSAIGQGTNLFSNVQLARYLSTLANGGNIMKLTLIDSIKTCSGKLVSDPAAEIIAKSGLADSTWDVIRAGMRAVVTENSGTKKNVTCDVQIAGKTGTAEENKLRPSHANFISYAPYDNPEIGMATSILNGYTAANSVKLSSDIYDFYYGKLTLQDILERDAVQASQYVIID
ncbi:MAG: penicillin-binding protein [Lachnospiraceae bacterium]|nr:penicillin-binding protein [Candidatus Minthocola equi]